MLSRRLEALLESCLSAPETAVGALDHLSPAERHLLLIEANDTAIDWEAHGCAHHLFEEWAARAPEAVAAECGEARLTYGELNARANQLARYLAKREVSRETLVAISLDTSLEMLVAVLGVLKAGGVYLPVDPLLSDRAPDAPAAGLRSLRPPGGPARLANV